MWTPLPWISWPRLCPVRCRTCAAKPASISTCRAVASTSKPRTVRPAAMPSWTNAMAASRAPAAAVHAAWTRSGTVAPVNAIQVMSAKTAPGDGSLPHRSSSSTSSRPTAPVRRGGGEVVRVAGVALGADDRGAVAPQVLVAEGLDHLLLDVELGEGAAGGERGADEGERPILDPIQADRGVLVRGQRRRRPRPPRTAGRGRPTTPPPRRATAPARWCRRRPGTGRGWRSPSSTPSPAGAGRRAGVWSPWSARRARRRRPSCPERRPSCGSRWRGRAGSACPRAGSGSTTAGWPCGPSPRRRSGGRRPGSRPGSRTAASRQGHPRGARLALPRCRAT